MSASLRKFVTTTTAAALVVGCGSSSDGPADRSEAPSQDTTATALTLETDPYPVQALGFSEPSAFHRACKRWTGRSPAELRTGTTDSIANQAAES